MEELEDFRIHLQTIEHALKYEGLPTPRIAPNVNGLDIIKLLVLLIDLMPRLPVHVLVVVRELTQVVLVPLQLATVRVDLLVDIVIKPLDDHLLIVIMFHLATVTLGLHIIKKFISKLSSLRVRLSGKSAS